MEQGNTITRRQLFALVFVGLLSPIIRLLPRQAVAWAGTAAWLSPLAAVPALLLLALVASRLLRDCGPGEGLGELLEKSLGRVPGRIAAGLFGVWIFVYAGFTLRAGAERLISTAYENADPGFFILLVMAVALLAARGRLRTLARTGEVFFLLLLVTVLAVLVFALPQMRAENLFPVYGRDLGGVLLGAAPVADVLSPWVYFLFLYKYVRREEGARSLLREALRWQGLALGLVLLLMVTTVGCFGGRFLLELQAPFFTMIRDVKIFNVIERIESVVIGIWVIADFAFAAGLLAAGGEALGIALGTGGRKWTVYAGAGAALAAAFWIAPDSFRFSYVSERVIPAINLAFLYGFLPLILLLRALRKKCKKGY